MRYITNNEKFCTIIYDIKRSIARVWKEPLLLSLLLTLLLMNSIKRYMTIILVWSILITVFYTVKNYCRKSMHDNADEKQDKTSFSNSDNDYENHESHRNIKNNHYYNNDSDTENH